MLMPSAALRTAHLVLICPEGKLELFLCDMPQQAALVLS